jgi:hypothetical protein
MNNNYQSSGASNLILWRGKEKMEEKEGARRGKREEGKHFRTISNCLWIQITQKICFQNNLIKL